MAKVKRKSIEKLKEEIIKRCKRATNETIDYAHEVFHYKMMDYYSEFDPEIYVRTYQLENSLKKENASVHKWYFTNIKGKVYFDTDSLDYSWKTLRGIGSWGNTYKRKGWTHENDLAVFRTSAWGNPYKEHGDNLSHGGYAEGTRVWTDPMNELKSDSNHWKDKFEENLKRNGVPIRKR